MTISTTSTTSVAGTRAGRPWSIPREPDSLENYWIVDPDAPTDDRFIAYRLDGETYRRVTALDGSTVRVNVPTRMEFALDQLIGS